VQDRDGARLVLDRRTRRLFPFIECIFADAGYQGPTLAAAVAKTGTWALEIVKRNELHRFVPQTLDRRAHARLDQPQSAPGARFRALCSNRRRLHTSRHDPPHAPTLDQVIPLLMNPDFLDRL
jgi:putative transposase